MELVPQIADAVEGKKKANRQHLVIALHGISTRGEWQKLIATPVAEGGFTPILPDYDHFKILWIANPFRRAPKVAWFREYYTQLRAKYPDADISVVAHSFGTYLITKAMVQDPNIKFVNVILCGSIVHRKYDWEAIAANGQVVRVLNDMGGADIPVRISTLAAPDMGWSGVRGFLKKPACLTERKFPLFGHSSAFNDGHFKNSWVPFLQGKDAGRSPVGPMESNRFYYLIVVAILLALFLAGFAVLHRIF